MLRFRSHIRKQGQAAPLPDLRRAAKANHPTRKRERERKNLKKQAATKPQTPLSRKAPAVSIGSDQARPYPNLSRGVRWRRLQPVVARGGVDGGWSKGHAFNLHTQRDAASCFGALRGVFSCGHDGDRRWWQRGAVSLCFFGVCLWKGMWVLVFEQGRTGSGYIFRVLAARLSKREEICISSPRLRLSVVFCILCVTSHSFIITVVFDTLFRSTLSISRP